MSAEPPHSRLIHVVAAAVIDVQGRILIAQRPAGKQLAGGWEFPGGKMEPGETRVEALARELQEELGITLDGQPRPLMRLRHTYPYGEVLLDMWVVRRYRGAPRGMDGQAIRWCTQEELEATDELLPADRPVVRALRLPERLVATATSGYTVGEFGDGPEPEASGGARLHGMRCRNLHEAMAAAATGGVDFLVMRGAPPPAELSSICAAVDLPVFARGSGVDEAWLLGLWGSCDF